MPCVFCDIAAGRTDRPILFRNEDVVAFLDARPIAPSHALIIPVRHVESLADAVDEALLGKLLAGARRAAKACGVLESGFRTLINTGAGGGQTVMHLHVHMIPGRPSL